MLGQTGAMRHHVDRWEQERRRAMLAEWMVVLGFFAVVAIILVIMVRLPAVP